MRLLYAPRSPFSRKVRITILELGLEPVVRLEAVDPWTDEAVRAVNPLGQVPVLVLDDGSSLHDSNVIISIVSSSFWPLWKACTFHSRSGSSCGYTVSMRLRMPVSGSSATCSTSWCTTVSNQSQPLA